MQACWRACASGVPASAPGRRTPAYRQSPNAPQKDSLTSWRSRVVPVLRLRPLGGVAGMVISLGAAGFGAIAHAQEKPALEAQLRATLEVVQAEMWQQLVEDPASGVLAGVHDITEQIEHGLASARGERWPCGAAMSAPEITGNRPDDDHQLQPLRAEFSGGG
jgi:hypothetical protein